MTSARSEAELAQLRAGDKSEQRAAIEALAQIISTPEEIEHLRLPSSARSPTLTSSGIWAAPRHMV
jgi:hypothetical protein